MTTVPTPYTTLRSVQKSYVLAAPVGHRMPQASAIETYTVKKLNSTITVE